MLLNMAENTKLKRFQKLIKAYMLRHIKRKTGKMDSWKFLKELKKLKDWNLDVTVDEKISKLKKPSTKKEVQSMAIWSKFISGNANKKHSGGSSQDVVWKRLLLSLLSLYLLKIHLNHHHHLIHQPSCHRQHLRTLKK